MDNFDGMSMPPYLANSMPTGAMDPDSYRTVLPPLGMQDALTPSYDTSDFGM